MHLLIRASYPALLE